MGYVKEKAIKQYFCVLGYGETGEVPVYGTHSILPKEHGAKFFALPIVRHLTREVGAIATWDSSIHDSVCLNTVTSGMSKNFSILEFTEFTIQFGSDLFSSALKVQFSKLRYNGVKRFSLRFYGNISYIA